jgi:YD repeat-containing protein
LYSYALDQSAREFEITLTHSNDGKTVVIRMPPSTLPGPEEHTAELNDNGQLLSYSIPDGSNRIVHRYEYNGDGDLLKRFYAAVTPTGTSEGLWYTNENFDGKPNPYFASKSLRMYLQLIGREPVSRHNFLLTKHYDGNGEVYRTDTRTNAYNGQGQLASQSVQIKDKTFSNVPLSYDLAYTYYCP